MKTKGCLIVRAIRSTRMGLGDRIVPPGTLGFVIGWRPGGKRIVWWKQLGPDWHGEHSADDLETVGRDR